MSHHTPTQPTSAPVFIAIALFGLGAGCALRPAFRNDGPVTSHEGVELAVVGQRCDQFEEPHQYGNDLVESVVEVQVRNATPAPLTVRRDAFRLITPDGFALKTLTWNAGQPVTMSGGQTRTFELRFMTRGSLECAREMVLDADSGLTLPAGPVRVTSVRFTPSPA